MRPADYLFYGDKVIGDEVALPSGRPSVWQLYDCLLRRQGRGSPEVSLDRPFAFYRSDKVPRDRIELQLQINRIDGKGRIAAVYFHSLPTSKGESKIYLGHSVEEAVVASQRFALENGREALFSVRLEDVLFRIDNLLKTIRKL